jgi:fermentation-respiration switch protein FrsA (DUF1100 family)
LIAYLVVLLILMLLEEKLIFFPTKYPAGDWHPAGLPVQDAEFHAADGTRLHGWYLPHEDPRAVVLFCHGNAGNVTHRADVLRMLHRVVGVSVLILDYRGYGRSEGSPSEGGILADARAARTWLAEREAVDPRDVVLLGRSLGGAVVVDLAAEDGARALVLESTFTSITDLAAHYYPWVPVRWLVRTRLDAAGKIAAYKGPLLQSHGDADSIVPFPFGVRLFDAANEPKEFITLHGQDHNDMPKIAYYEALIEFLDGLP